MSSKTGFLWDSPQLFNRYLQDCGVACETITPQLLAAPFFRGQYAALIIPTGFANRRYSRLLPALRSRSGRIRSFVENGGRLLVFGAAETNPDAYDWLWFRAEYMHSYEERRIVFDRENPFPPLVERAEDETAAVDGYFSSCDGTPLAALEDGRVVMCLNRLGEGLVILTSIHEYPSRRFLTEFCCGGRETLF